MSPALSDLPVRKVIRTLESIGFEYVRTKGSHAVYRHRTDVIRIERVETAPMTAKQYAPVAATLGASLLIARWQHACGQESDSGNAAA